MARQVSYFEIPTLVETVEGRLGASYECDQFIPATGWYEVQWDHMRGRVRLVPTEKLEDDAPVVWTSSAGTFLPFA